MGASSPIAWDKSNAQTSGVAQITRDPRPLSGSLVTKTAAFGHTTTDEILTASQVFRPAEGFAGIRANGAAIARVQALVKRELRDELVAETRPDRRKVLADAYKACCHQAKTVVDGHDTTAPAAGKSAEKSVLALQSLVDCVKERKARGLPSRVIVDVDDTLVDSAGYTTYTSRVIGQLFDLDCLKHAVVGDEPKAAVFKQIHDEWLAKGRPAEQEAFLHTIERVKAVAGPEALVYFLIGADAFAEITTWHRWSDVVRGVTFIVVTRPGHNYQAPPGASVRRLTTLAMPVSSSDIRARLAVGKDPPELPPAVMAYIRTHGLYGYPAGKP